MKILRSFRLVLLALLVSLIPASSFAGVFVSVSFAPPLLPVYEQPPCPDPGWMWVPGYWAYGEGGYYWVPGTWVPAPYEGALWTPPYWGWENNFYIFHPGYWGRHVGYYGGVNYGFGYMGIGFVGGMWRGHDFVYNRAVMRVDERRIHNTYIDRTIVERNTIVNDRRVAFSGGRDGIHHDPRPDERFAERDRHMGETTFQHSHVSAAMSDRSSYVKNNGGRPSYGAVQRPLGNNPQGVPSFDRGHSGRDSRNAPAQMQNREGGGNPGRGAYTAPNRSSGDNRNFNNPHSSNPNPDNRNFNTQRGNSGNPQAQYQSRPAPEFRQTPQQRPAPQAQPRSEPQPHSAPAPQQHEHGRQPQHEEHGDHQH